MKKLLLIAAFAATVAQNIFAQTPCVMRRHGDKITLFSDYNENGSSLQAAVDSCEDGDILYLNKGAFHNGNDLNIKKAITIIGVGAEDGSVIKSSSVNISYNGTGITTFSGIKFTGRVTFSNTTNLKKCSILDFIYCKANTTTMVENCWINEFHNGGNQGTNYNSNMLVQNCIINRQLSYFSVNTSHQHKFINCYFNNGIKQCYGNFNQCIIASSLAQTTGFFSNCLFLFDESATTIANAAECIFDSSITMDDITPELLAEKGYLGSDGTIIGAYGGIKPYTLTTAGMVTSATVAVDNERQELNVKLKTKQ